MLLGHYAVGFALKKASPKLSLGTLFLASQFIDLIWPLFILIGLERVSVDPGNTVVTPLDFEHYPFTHSLLGVLAWAVLFGLAYWAIKRKRVAAIWLGAAVVSHWALDLIVHRPDLPLFPGSSIFAGFGAWNSMLLTIILEGGLFAGGIFLYMKTTVSNDKTGSISLISLIIFLSVVYLANIFGPPPPDSGKIIAASALLLWLIIPWGYWIDRHRSVRN